MIEVKDEILAEEPTYRIYDKNGKVLFDNLKIEQITPVIQEGTQLNKVLFDSIKKDINDRLLISSKATIEQAVGGTDDSNYMTPLKTLNAVADGCKVVVNNVDVTANSTSYEINVDDYVTPQTLFLDITMFLREIKFNVEWQPRENSKMLTFNFSEDGNSISINQDNVNLTNAHEKLALKIIADVKAGMAIVYCYKFNVVNEKITHPSSFEKAMIVNFSPGTFGKLTFRTESSGNNINTFEIKEYRKFN